MATAPPRVQEVPVYQSAASCSRKDAAHIPAHCPTMSLYGPPTHQDDDPVDLSRLSHIYREHAREFWSAIAAKYSGGIRLTPTELESAFFEARAANGGYFGRPMVNSVSKRPVSAPVSRETSVDMSRLRHVRSSSTMSIAGKVSVESLLNHDGV